MSQSLTTYSKQAFDYAKPYLQATTNACLNAVKNTPLPERLKNISQKELALAGIVLSWALYIEKESGIPLCSGIPQLIGFIFTMMAHALQKFSDTTDPWNNSATAYSFGLAAGYLVYLCYNTPKTAQGDIAPPPAPSADNEEMAVEKIISETP